MRTVWRGVPARGKCDPSRGPDRRAGDRDDRAGLRDWRDAAGGPRAGYNLLLRLVQAVKRVARRTAGIRHVELVYSRERMREAYA